VGLIFGWAYIRGAYIWNDVYMWWAYTRWRLILGGLIVGGLRYTSPYKVIITVVNNVLILYF
jgi:hypothetical protein